MLDKHILDQIEDGHAMVIGGYKDTIKGALMAGEALIRAREVCKHGEFEAVVNSFSFSRATAFQYIKVYEYSAKVQQLGHLQEAYKLIESEEAKKKQAKAQEQQAKIQYREQYNKKPDTWERADDYAWEQHIKAKKAADERIEAFKKATEEAKEASKNQNIIDEEATKQAWESLNNYFADEQTKLESLAKIKITNQNGMILSAIDKYLVQFDSNTQLEEIANIIKYCKHKGAEIQADINK